MRVLARLAWLVVRAYQIAAAGRLSVCRYVPSCSNYALEALETQGAVRGGWLVLRRLGRCHPWGRTGWDPVPAPGASVRLKEPTGV